MKKFIFVLIALLFGVVAMTIPTHPAHATTGEIFVYGMSDNHMLAAAIRESRKAHPDGNSAVSDESCHRISFRGCGTPNDYVRAYREMLNDLPQGVTVTEITLQNVDVLIDKFEERTVPVNSRWWSYCKKKPGGVSAPILAKCSARKLFKGERAYGLPGVTKILLVMHCSNPGGDEDKPIGCLDVYFDTLKGDEPHIGNAGPEQYVDDKDCPTALQKVGEDELGSTLADECPGCTFAAPAVALGLPVQSEPRVSYKAEDSFASEQVVHNRLRISAKWLNSPNDLLFCLVRADGQKSLAVVVYKTSYHRNAKGELAVYITYKGKFTPDEKWLTHGTTYYWEAFDGSPF